MSKFETSVQKQVLKAMTSCEFYQEYGSRIRKEYFDPSVERLLTVIGDAHTKYDGVDLTRGQLLQIMKSNYVMTEAQRSQYNEVLKDLYGAEPIDHSMASDMINALYEEHKAQQVAEYAIDVMNRGDRSLSDLKDFVANVDSYVESEDVPKELDVDTMLQSYSSEGLFTFPEPLDTRVLGAGRGHVLQIFARPETGKSSFVAWLTANWMKQGHKVLYMSNEEPGAEVNVLRSLTETAKHNLDTEKVKKTWNTHRHNLVLYHKDSMTLQYIREKIQQHTPDVVIVDQLDNCASLSGSDSSVERLGELYREARGMAIAGSLLMVEVSQASDSASGKSRLTMSDMANSKTEKPAQADMIIGIGMSYTADGIDYGGRTLNFVKNKICAGQREQETPHPIVPMTLERDTATWKP